MKKSNNMKKLFLTMLTLGVSVIVAIACPVCEKQQPKLLQGITHGTGPESNWDWVIVGSMTAITLFVAIASVFYLFRPGEKQPNHIKLHILSPAK
jgi:hypothetical protein